MGTLNANYIFESNNIGSRVNCEKLEEATHGNGRNSSAATRQKFFALSNDRRLH